MKSSITSLHLSLWLTCLAPGPAQAQPVIYRQPDNSFISGDSPPYFSVGVKGTAPISYQWLFNGNAIRNATNSSLLLLTVQPSQWGFYSVIASNTSGSVTSQVAEFKAFVPAPHKFRAIQAQAGGSMELTLAGETDASFAPYYDLYPLEVSSNLVDWTPLALLQRTNTALDTLHLVDTNAAHFPQRFYRTPAGPLPTPGPLPSGPYPVGTFSMVMADPSRTNAIGKTNFQFMTTFWYPATVRAGILPARYVETQIALDAGYDYYNFGNVGGGNWDNQAAGFYSHSQSNALVATDLRACPVILYSHGAGNHRRECTDKAEELASWGYIVISLDARDTGVSVFPNGAVVMGTWAGLEPALEDRLRDLQFVLDQLPVLNSSDPRLAGRLDLDRIGAFGWSLGGMTVAQLCLRDPRCKAAAGLDGWFAETNVLTQPLGVPFLFLRSDFGPDPNPWYFSGTPLGLPFNCIEVFNEQNTNAYWVKLGSTAHGNFADYDLIADAASMQAGFGLPMSGRNLPLGRAGQIIRTYLVSFFNKHLRGQDDHLLDGPPPAFPEVMQFLSKSGVSGPPACPLAPLVLSSDGNFYGTTAYGGATGNGTVYRVTSGGALTVLVSFNGTNAGVSMGALLPGSDGGFYGTTEFGGAANLGTVFHLSAAGVLTSLVSFNGPNGSHPVAGLVLGNDGNLCGTTMLGGAYNLGTVYRVTPAGVLTTLVSFHGSNGASPFAGLVQGPDGNFYGTTVGGSLGTVFRMTPSGALTTLQAFGGSLGENPAAALVMGADGNFYGTAAFGGILSIPGFDTSSGAGTVFKLTTAGQVSEVFAFNAANGYNPTAELIQTSDGSLYGTTAGGGMGGFGTVFKVMPSGAFSSLVSFNGANGSTPRAPLIQASDGSFYGTTELGGISGRGTVFRLTPAGALTTVVSF